MEAYHRSQQTEAVVQCNFCDYWGLMTGFLDPENKDVIQFVCPTCDSIEAVTNFLK
jgi:Zn finger protein HypA/HybF involved in hydrogenase expression